jgi:hypothetical protein
MPERCHTVIIGHAGKFLLQATQSENPGSILPLLMSTLKHKIHPLGTNMSLTARTKKRIIVNRGDRGFCYLCISLSRSIQGCDSEDDAGSTGPRWIIMVLLPFFSLHSRRIRVSWDVIGGAQDCFPAGPIPVEAFTTKTVVSHSPFHFTTLI